MKSKLLTAFLFVSTIFLAECYDCEFCKGNLCNANEIPVISCDEQPTDSLPYNFNVTFNESMEACLDLEYVEDEKVYPVKQCFRLSESYDICDEVRSVLPLDVKLKKCKIMPDVKNVKNNVLTYQLSDNYAAPTIQSSNLQGHNSPSHSSPSPPVTVHSTQHTVHSSPLAAEHTTHTTPTTHPTTHLTTHQASSPTTQATTHSTSHASTPLPNEPTKLTTSAPTTTEKPGGHSNIAIVSLFAFTTSLIIQMLL